MTASILPSLREIGARNARSVGRLRQHHRKSVAPLPECTQTTPQPRLRRPARPLLATAILLALTPMHQNPAMPRPTAAFGHSPFHACGIAAPIRWWLTPTTTSLSMDNSRRSGGGLWWRPTRQGIAGRRLIETMAGTERSDGPGFALHRIDRSAHASENSSTFLSPALIVRGASQRGGDRLLIFGTSQQTGAPAVLQPVALAADVDRRRVVRQAIQDRRGDDRVAEDRAPLAITLVRGQDDAAPLIARADQLKEDRRAQISPTADSPSRR